MGVTVNDKIASLLSNQQGGFPNLPFTPGVISTPQATPPYYGFEKPDVPRTPTISSYQPDLKTKIADALFNAVKGSYPGSEALGLLGQVVYHGSPHMFDKFRMDKIGTGEGAQAYGHGLYFAENPATAKAYADSVKDMSSVDNINAELSRLSKVMDKDSAGQYRQFKSALGEQAAKQYDELMAKKMSTWDKPGNMYKVDLPDESIAKMLDWDKPLSQQPAKVIEALQKSDLPLAEHFGYSLKEFMALPAERQAQLRKMAPGAEVMGTGQTIYDRLAHELGGQAQASEYLKNKGIPGVKYLDGFSRKAQEGSRNYVVFDENLPKILERK